MARLAVLAAMLCGCAQLFGIDETTKGGGGDDAPPPSSSLTVQRVSIGARLVYTPQDLAGLMATYLASSEAAPGVVNRVSATQAQTGQWTAPLETAAPIFYNLPDFPKPISRILDFPQTQAKTLFGVLEHPNPQPIPMGATLSVNVVLGAPLTGTDLFEIDTLGSWNTLALSGPVGNTLVQTFAFTAMNSITTRPHEKITSDDSVVVLHYDNVNHNHLLASFKAPPFDQTGNDKITGAMTPVALQQSSFTIDQADALRRLGTVKPPVGGVPFQQWTVRAAPGAQLNNDTGPFLASGGPTTATSVSFQAGNPFAPDWPSTVLWQVQEARTYMPPSLNLPVTLVANVNERALLEPGLQMKLPAGLPMQVTVGTTVLATDGATIAKPAGPVEVSFTTDAASNTAYQLQLFKLVPNAANTALQLELKLGATGVAPRFLLPPELFEAGAVYTLRAIGVEGCFPGVAQGDLTQRTLPCAVSFLDSGAFQVAP